MIIINKEEFEFLEKADAQRDKEILEDIQKYGIIGKPLKNNNMTPWQFVPKTIDNNTKMIEVMDRGFVLEQNENGVIFRYACIPYIYQIPADVNTEWELCKYPDKKGITETASYVAHYMINVYNANLWYDVADYHSKLPKENEQVLCLFEDNTYVLCEYNGENFMLLSAVIKGLDVIMYPIKWMEIPK